MSTVTLRLPEYLHEAIKELALRERVTINQLLTLAAAEKVSALLAEDYLEERAQRGDRKAFERVMSKVPRVEPEADDAIREERSGYLVHHPITAEGGLTKPPFDVVRQRIVKHQGEDFRLRRGTVFTYTVRGDMVYTDRTTISFAMSQLEQAYEVVPLSNVADVPKQLWAPSYVYSILMDDRIRQGDW